MGSIITSMLVTAASEMGDKSQLLALLLGLRFRKPVAIVISILIATAMSNIMAAVAGNALASLVDPRVMTWATGVLFLAMALWAAMPDQINRDHVLTIKEGGIIIAPGLSFFVAELCDKSQLATATLAAQYGNVIYVLIGTTLGMMLVNTPVVVFGLSAGRAVRQLPTRYIAGGLLALAGCIILMGGRPF
jgi:Ca2+/H+ antiporter, TMEM165/GDT1 family